MTPKQFDRIANELFGDVLTPLGFSNEKSRRCTFHRIASDEVTHFVMPDLGSHGVWFDVKVFPASSLLDPSFKDRFPDGLGIPTDSWSYLSDRGVGLDQQQFNCVSEENLRRRFELSIKPLLLEKAIPYLDRFQSVESMLPVIKHSSALCLAMYHAGRREEARILLRKEAERLSKLDRSQPVVAKLLERVTQLLGES